MIQQIIHSLQRRRAMSRYASCIPTGLHPLSRIRTAAVFLDFEERDWEDSKALAEDFFKKHGIEVHFYYNDFSSTNWYGGLKSSEHNPDGICEEDLFISLLDSTDFFIHFSAASSRAITKIGRVQLPKNVFDIVVNGSDEQESGQIDSLRTIFDILSLIK